MNPLNKTIARMVKAAEKGTKEAKFAGPYIDPQLVRLANSRLAGAGIETRLSQANTKPKMVETSSVVLFSGGVYSYIALLRELCLGRQVHAVFVGDGPARDLAYHLEWAWHEEGPSLDSPVAQAFQHAKTLVKGASLDVHTLEVGVPSHPALDDMIRFGLAAEVAANTEVNRIVTGHLRHNYDLRLFREMSGIASQAYGRKLQFIAPMCTDSPQGALEGYTSLGFDPTMLIADSYSCENPETETLQPQCGTCWGCYRRWRVFSERGWIEKHFLVLPWEGPDFVTHEVRWRGLG